jgi:DNA-directed RNA polymerase specialized sigma24 family protein
MPPHPLKPEILWPDLGSSYVDEFGFIDQTVYEVARNVWPRVALSVARTLRDSQAGQRIMMKAAALVSRKLKEDPERITNLHGYLYKTFVRSLREELEREGRHAELGRASLVKNDVSRSQSDEALFQKILVHQILKRTDPRMRRIFELLLLGYSLEEIAKAQGTAANHLRSYWSREIRRLRTAIEAEVRRAELKVKPSRQTT